MGFDTSQDSYRSLRTIIAERTDRVLAWVGSGLSTGAGLPDWSSLRTILENALSKKAETFEPKEARSLLNMGKTIKSIQDIWTAFELLRSNLGDTSWRAIIKEALGVTPTIKTPNIYKSIWKLKIHGMLNLNLDRFVTKAHSEMGGPYAIEFNGIEARNYAYVLKSPRQFICNLHGNIDDVTSWVLTKSDLKSLLGNKTYQNYINACLSSKTILFLGISADDIAVGSFLEASTKLGINFGDHYWITDRRDKATDDFAESIGIRIIRYNASGNDHSELDELLKDLLTFVSPEDPVVEQPAFINPCQSGDLELPNAKDILKLDTESIRKTLNNRAIQILSDTSLGTYKAYEKFSNEYDEAIYRCWYTSLKPGSNILCGYTLNRQVAYGAFGTVFHASSTRGEEVAVKLLHEEIRRDLDLLHSFRRGVHSMSILSKHNVEGMVAYKDASEIPAFVVMDWINGPSVTDAVKAKLIDGWRTILKIGTRTSSIVRKGHLLPERVLHRDLRPSNIMLKGFYVRPEEYEVVVLDFDLSWYRGSFEKSIIHGSAMAGYLAPEQIQRTTGVSTRNTAVDSFGLGMTLFFMCSGRDPVQEEHLHRDWVKTVHEATHNIPRCSWSSVPTRFARLILNATQHNQKDRWEMSQIEGELQRLLDAADNPESVESAELVAEEIAARCTFMDEYTWDDDNAAAKKETASGMALEVLGDESNRLIRIALSWGKPGVRGHESVGKWIPQAMNSAVAILKKGGWLIEEAEQKYTNIRIKAYLSVKEVVSSLDKLTDNIEQATNRLRFD